MTLDLDKAGKPLRRLRKLLKGIGPEPTPDEVHDLRTWTRKLEASLHTMPDAGGKNGKRSLKWLKPVRKLAGKVRDKDVLMAKAAPLCDGCEGMEQLLKQLAEERSRAARKLHKAVEERSGRARRALRATLDQLNEAQDGNAAESAGGAAPQKLADQLEHWPKLHHDNLHDFRKGVKELRYMMQLFEGADEEQIAAFAQVKDAVGEWHDWLELKHAAEQVFKGEESAVLRDIRAETEQKLREAMTAANALRRHGFGLVRAA